MHGFGSHAYSFINAKTSAKFLKQLVFSNNDLFSHNTFCNLPDINPKSILCFQNFIHLLS